METYLYRQQDVSRIIKSIVNPRRIVASRSPHHWLYKNHELASDENEQPVKTASSAPATAEVLRINHYWSKSLEDGQNKVARGSADRWTAENDPRSMELWHKFDKAFNAVEDREILRFVPALKQRLKMRGTAVYPPRKRSAAIRKTAEV